MWYHFSLYDIFGNAKSSIYVVDGCHDRISLQSLDPDIYMKVSDGVSIPDASAKGNMFCVKLNKSLYGLKQSERIWYNQLSKFLIQKGYSNNDDFPCFFIKKSSSSFQCTSWISTSLATHKILMKHAII
jgi:hypothetical protein